MRIGTIENGIVTKVTDAGDLPDKKRKTLVEKGSVLLEPWAEVGDPTEDGHVPVPAAVLNDLARARRIARMWQSTRAYVTDRLDELARLRYLDWKYDPAVSAERRVKIQACLDWSDAVWALYTKARTAVQNGEDALLSLHTAGPCPYTFSEIATTA